MTMKIQLFIVYFKLNHDEKPGKLKIKKIEYREMKEERSLLLPFSFSRDSLLQSKKICFKILDRIINIL